MERRLNLDNGRRIAEPARPGKSQAWGFASMAGLGIAVAAPLFATLRFFAPGSLLAN